MQNIIYSKISNERRKEFQILTQIIQNDDGKRLVLKKSLLEVVNKHLDTVANNYCLLVSLYTGTKFCPNKVIRTKYGLEFDYLEGDTLESHINSLYNKNDLQNIKKIICSYTDNIRKLAKEPFRISDDFIKWFGNVSFSSTQLSCTISNIDMVFNNIILKNDIWHVIDYEWVFLFPIPVDFIVYRAVISLNIETETIFKEIGISDSDLMNYKAMEECFQRNVIGHEVLLSGFLKQSKSIYDLENEKQVLSLRNQDLEKERQVLSLRNQDLENEKQVLNLRNQDLENEKQMLSLRNQDLENKINIIIQKNKSFIFRLKNLFNSSVR